jgi:hypothetical protein
MQIYFLLFASEQVRAAIFRVEIPSLLLLQWFCALVPYETESSFHMKQGCHSIDIVVSFQGFCGVISMEWFRHFNGMVPSFQWNKSGISLPLHHHPTATVLQDT